MSFAKVWETKNQWDEVWEARYSLWVKDHLHTDIFISSGPLVGISTDCADAIYDIRIIFSYLNSLPFIINAPDALKEKMITFSNETDMFDDIPNGQKRLRAFVNYINDEVGTENLVKDTFPVNIKSINSGVVYLVEWSLFKKVNRHSYIIKGFDDDHELVYYASDAPRKVRELQIDTKYPRFSFEEAPFGFRKWRKPEFLKIPENLIPESEGYSTQQYKLAAKFGKKNVLKVIRKILKQNLQF